MGTADLPAERLRLLVLAADYPPSDSSEAARYLASYCTALGSGRHDVHVVTGKYSDWRSQYSLDGVKVCGSHHCSMPGNGRWTAEVIARSIAQVERSFDLATRGLNFDAVIAQDWHASLAGVTLKRRMSLPLIAAFSRTAVGRTGNKLTRDQLYEAELENWLIQHADHVLCPSRSLADELKAHYRLSPQLATVAPASVPSSPDLTQIDLGAFRRLLASLDEVIVLCDGSGMGRAVSRKTRPGCRISTSRPSPCPSRGVRHSVRAAGDDLFEAR